MENNLLELLIKLETELVEYYQHMKSLSGVSNSIEIFEYMIKQSKDHENRVRVLKETFKYPSLNQKFIDSLHRQIEESLLLEARKSESVHSLMDRTAKAEELIGKLYMVLANHCIEISTGFNRLESEISKIASEEYEHRDAIIHEKVKYPGSK